MFCFFLALIRYGIEISGIRIYYIFVGISEKQWVYETCEYALWGITPWKHE